MYTLRDKTGISRATLHDDIVGAIMRGNIGEWKQRDLVTVGKVLVYEIVVGGHTIGPNRCEMHLHEGDYLRRL